MNCGLCDRKAADGYLCVGCLRRTDDNLAALPGLYDALLRFLQPGRTGDHGGRRTTREAPLPVAELPLTMRGPGGMVGVCEDWRSALHCDLGWTEPKPRGTYEDRLARAVRGLRNNILWIGSSWPPAGAFAEEIRDLVLGAKSIVDPPEPTLRIGECAALLPDGSVCGAVLRVPAGVTEVSCKWCGAEYPPSLWLALRDGTWNAPAPERTPS